MKSFYISPEFDLHKFSFEEILSSGVVVSDPEHGSSDHSDDDTGEW